MIVVCRYAKCLKLMLTSQPNYAGWSSSARLAWHDMLPCIACATCCFSVCLYGDHEATSGECFPVYSFIGYSGNYTLPWLNLWSMVCRRVMTHHRRTHCSFWNFFHLWSAGSLCQCHQDCLFIGMCISLFYCFIQDHEFTTPSLFIEFYNQIINQIHYYFVLTPCFPLGLQTMSSAQPSKCGYGKWVERSL